MLFLTKIYIRIQALLYYARIIYSSVRLIITSLITSIFIFINIFAFKLFMICISFCKCAITFSLLIISFMYISITAYLLLR